MRNWTKATIRKNNIHDRIRDDKHDHHDHEHYCLQFNNYINNSNYHDNEFNGAINIVQHSISKHLNVLHRIGRLNHNDHDEFNIFHYGINKHRVNGHNNDHCDF